MKFSWLNAVACLLALSAPVFSWSASDLTPRIFNGENATSAPSYMAFLAVIPNGAGVGGQCGASLISSRWLLTAAHCVDFFVEGEYTIEVRMGATDITSDMVEVFGVDTVIIHPDYNGFGVDTPVADLALLRLDRSASGYAPVPILSSAAQASLPDGSAATIYGWGLTSPNTEPPLDLQVASVDYLSAAACNAGPPWDGDVNDDSVCSLDDLSGVCSGDSGGPLVVTQSGTDYLVGVASYVIVDQQTGSCVVGTPDVYMSPAYYYGWIAEVTGLLTLDGDTSFGLVGVNQPLSRSFKLINSASGSVDIPPLTITGTGADKFTLAENQCGATLAAGALCTFRVIASAANAGAAQADILLDRPDSNDISFRLTAEFLPALATDAALQINGGQWYSNSLNGWVAAYDMGQGGTSGFESGVDDESSHLLLHVSGPLQLVMDGSSLYGGLFDGVMVQRDDVPLRWYRLDNAETTLRVDVPEGAHRILFSYEKRSPESSQVGIYNFRTTALGGSGGGGGGSGGSLGFGLLMLAGALGWRRYQRVTG